jgi:hypothetical protein
MYFFRDALRKISDKDYDSLVTALAFSGLLPLPDLPSWLERNTSGRIATGKCGPETTGGSPSSAHVESVILCLISIHPWKGLDDWEAVMGCACW